MLSQISMGGARMRRVLAVAVRVSIIRVSIIGLLVPTCGFAEPVKVEDPLQSPAWQHFYNNEYDEALADFTREVSKQPNDATAYNHLAQAILYRELFRNG